MKNPHAMTRNERNLGVFSGICFRNRKARKRANRHIITPVQLALIAKDELATRIFWFGKDSLTPTRADRRLAKRLRIEL